MTDMQEERKYCGKFTTRQFYCGIGAIVFLTLLIIGGAIALGIWATTKTGLTGTYSFLL